MAKEKSITPAVIENTVSYNPETGKFTRLKPSARGPAGSEAGLTIHRGYRAVGVGGHRVLAHRLAWFIAYGSWPDGDIDHINGDRSDNRIANLRCVTSSVNMQNRRSAQLNSASKTLGVTWHKHTQKWRATIVIEGRSQHIGLFDSQAEAQASYLEAKRRLHPGCTI